MGDTGQSGQERGGSGCRVEGSVNSHDVKVYCLSFSEGGRAMRGVGAVVRSSSRFYYVEG